MTDAPFKSRLLRKIVADEETIRHVALELVRVGREVPEASWHEGAEDYAIALGVRPAGRMMMRLPASVRPRALTLPRAGSWG